MCDIAQVLESAQRPDERLRKVIDLLRDLVPYTHCALLCAEGVPAPELLLVPAPSEAGLPAVRSVLQRLLVSLQDAAVHHKASALASAAALGWRSHLAVPLVGLDRVVGLLAVGQDAPDAFTEEHLALLSVVASQVAVYLAALATRMQEERYRQIVETSLEGIFQVAADDRFVFVNERMAELTGYTRDELVGQPGEILDMPDDAAATQERRAARHGGDLRKAQYERTLRRKDGSAHWIHVSLVPLVDDRGGYDGFFGVALDIQQRKLAEEALREEERRRHDDLVADRDRLQQILDVLPSGLVIMDASSNVTMLNRAARALLGRNVVGLAREEFNFDARRPDGTALPWHDLPTVRALELGEPSQDVQLLLRHATTGSDIPVLQSVALLRDAAGSTVGIVTALQDISPLKAVEHEREQLLVQTAEARDRLQQIIEFLPVGLILYDGEAQRVGMNRTAVDILGTGVVSRPIDADYHAIKCLDGAPLPYAELPIIRSVFHQEVVIAEQLVFSNPDTGAQTPVLLSTAPLRAEDGTQRGGIAVFQDISRLRALEQEREQLLAQMQATLSASPHAVVVSDAQGQATYMNAEATRLLGPASAARGTTPADRAAILQTVAEDGTPIPPEATATARALRGETVRDVIMGTRQPSTGAQTWVLISAAPIRTAAGEIVGAVNTFADITEQHEHQQARERLLAAEQRAREDLASERARLQRILDVLPEGVVILDAALRVVGMNQAAEALLGVSMLGGQRADFDLGAKRIDGTRLPWAEFPSVRALHTGKTVRGLQAIMRNAATGEDFPVLAGGAPLPDAAGVITGVVAVFQDISVIKAVERQRDRVLAAVAHDLRNPLTSIAGMSQLLQLRSARLEASVRERFVHSLQTIETAARNMTVQISELLDYAQAQTGRQIDLTFEPSDIVALLRRVLAEHQQSTDDHTLELRAQEEPIVAEVDPRRLERAIANLVVNAIKYSPKGGPIVVTAARTAGPDRPWLSIDVADRGLGIPSADLPRIFEQYYRASNVASTIPGTGIGLAGVRHIVERHGGSVAIESVEGKGTTVTVRLPLLQPAPNVEASPNG